MKGYFAKYKKDGKMYKLSVHFYPDNLNIIQRAKECKDPTEIFNECIAQMVYLNGNFYCFYHDGIDLNELKKKCNEYIGDKNEWLMKISKDYAKNPLKYNITNEIIFTTDLTLFNEVYR